MDPSGYIPPGGYPRYPVEWSRFGQTQPQRITSTSSSAPDTIYDLNPTGWDSFGLRFACTGLQPTDQVVGSVESPEGFVYQSVTMTCGSFGDVANGATAVPVEVQSDRYLIRCYLVTAVGTTSAQVQVTGYIKAGCRERY
jgi:hypothetical protein